MRAVWCYFFFFQAEDGIRDVAVTGVQTCALPICTRPDAYETPKLKEYVSGFPQAAVARDQLKFATAELSTFQTGRVRKALDDAIQAALTGGKSPADALKAAQQDRSEEHTSELQSRLHLVCRLLLEKKK